MPIGRLVTFGVNPSYPETDMDILNQWIYWGSFEKGSNIKRFIEKPSLRDAEEYIKHINFSGIVEFSFELMTF